MGKVVQVLEGLIELDIPPMPRLLQAIEGSHSAFLFTVEKTFKFQGFTKLFISSDRISIYVVFYEKFYGA
jgi:hypothetical protein